MEITYTKNTAGEYIASTGEMVAYYKGENLWGRGSSGWYITEQNGEFRGNKFDKLADAKYFIARRHSFISEDFSKYLAARVMKALA